MIREPDTMGAAAWLVACVAATLILLVAGGLWLVATALLPSATGYPLPAAVLVWLLDAGPMTPLALLALGLLMTGVPR